MSNLWGFARGAGWVMLGALEESGMSQSQVSLVAQYFAAVDAERLEDILALLTEDCVFSVETHGVRLCGHAEISGMFRRLWGNHTAVQHHSFRYVDDPEMGRISVQFQVENTEANGSVTYKSNCNFFDVEGERFSKVAVYMAGVNTLEEASSGPSGN